MNSFWWQDPRLTLKTAVEAWGSRSCWACRSMNGFLTLTHWVSIPKSRSPSTSSGRTGFWNAQLRFLGLPAGPLAVLQLPYNPPLLFYWFFILASPPAHFFHDITLLKLCMYAFNGDSSLLFSLFILRRIINVFCSADSLKNITHYACFPPIRCD